MNKYSYKEIEDLRSMVVYSGKTVRELSEALSSMSECTHGPSICAQLDQLGDTGSLVAKLSISWGGYSGQYAFPVPHPLISDAYRAWYSSLENQTFWEGEYGDNRRELCLYLAKELQSLKEIIEDNH